MSDPVELLFFDTFAHDNTEEINLDLVQFPKPVYVTEVRIIPLGARVQADFPGGVRLGATNPSQFQIEFFVNDLGKPGASTFESLGGFEYNQNDCINLDCVTDKENVRRIPTDGLVLKGWYTTITLAVYGTLTNNISEQIIQPAVNPALPNQSNPIVDTQQILTGNTIKNEWNQENLAAVPIEYNANTNTEYQPQYNQQSENYTQEYSEYYSDVPKDPRNYHHTPETSTADWPDNKTRPRANTESDRDRNRDSSYQKPGGSDHSNNRAENRDKNYQRGGHSREGETRTSREYRDVSRERDWNNREQQQRPQRHDDRRNNGGSDDRKRPRTPPTLPAQSPKRPHTPHTNNSEQNKDTPIDSLEDDATNKSKEEKVDVKKSPVREETTPLVEEQQEQPSQQQLDVEEFEPILSDEDILDEEIDYDYTTYTNNDDLIKLFVPGVTNLRKFVKTPIFTLEKDSLVIDENLKTTIGIIDDYFKSSITKYTIDEYERLNTEIKEEFIHLCEKLIAIFGTVENFCDIIQIYTKLPTIDSNNFANNDDKELLEQVRMIAETLIDWLKIALNYEMANLQTQPPYKIRHIKCGVKLIEFCCNSVDFIKLLCNNDFNTPKLLLELYDKEYMALSIKLMIMKALDTYLLHKHTIERFLYDDFDHDHSTDKENGYHDRLRTSPNNGYRILVEKLMKNPSVRLKFSINSILKKLNLYEICHQLHSILLKIRNNDYNDHDIELIIDLLNQLLNYFDNGEFVLQQPKRFLPVSAQFEINRCDNSNNKQKNLLINYFYMFDLLQCFFLLLTKLNLITIKIPIYELMSELLKTIDGLNYLKDNCEILNYFVKYLLKTDDELQYSIQNFIDIKSHNLGVELATKIECLYLIENLQELGRKYQQDFEQYEIIDQLHQLYCLTFNYKGRLACVELLTNNNNIECLLQFFGDLFNAKDRDCLLIKYKKSPSIGYIIDLIYFTVITIANIQFLENYYKQFLQIIDHIDIFEDALQLRLNEIRNYLSPFISITALNYDNITPILEIIQKNLDSVTLYPGQLITSLRLLHYFGINPHLNNKQSLIENPLSHYIELKYKHVILQIFSLDGTAILTKLLQKICEYYEQPSLHTSIFVSNQGLSIINTIKPCIALLKQILTYVIHCRNTNFKDLTTIPILLQIYNLLDTYPATCNYHLEALQICEQIIECLLVYTQPISDEINEKDSLNKTLWTMMCNEIIKFTLTKPCNYQSGLLILSELLPLPLPIQCRYDLKKDEIMWLVNLRRLWSAHLYPLNNLVQEMIEQFCTTSCIQLLNLLKRICIQLSDLTSNTSILIVRTILDLIYKNLTISDDQFVVNCNSHVLRLLNFLACLVTHNTLKCTVLHLIHTKNNEKYPQLIQIFGQILKNNSNTSNHHVQSQECILSIIQSFCDIEITLLQNNCENIDAITSDIYLSNALPIKDYLVLFIQMIIDHLIIENSFITYLPAIRTLLLLTEHDYGFYHLKELLLKRNDTIFTMVLTKLCKNFVKDNTECLSTLNTLAEFIRVCITNDDDVNNSVETNLLYQPRKIKMSLNEIKLLIGWKDDDDGGGDHDDKNDDKHPLLQLEEILKKLTSEDVNFDSLLESVTTLLKMLRGETIIENNNKDTSTEPILPEPENLLIQYTGRLIYSSTDICDERLTIRYWLSIPNDDSENETIACDLTEMARQFLPQDLSVTREIEKLYRISPLETIDNEKEKNDSDQKIKTKKPFITPMRPRGFPRTMPQRSDLFRSRPPNTSRPPSLHVDDFVALETCGAQPTGPTGYNKFSRELLASNRIARGSRGRAFVASERSWWGTSLLRGPYP